MILDKFENIFYGDTVTVLKISVSGGYDREEGIQILCTVKGDLQSYSGGLAQKEYGLNAECQKRFFCAENECIKAGNYIDADGVRYRIEYVENTRLGMTAVLREERLCPT